MSEHAQKSDEELISLIPDLEVRQRAEIAMKTIHRNGETLCAVQEQHREAANVSHEITRDIDLQITRETMKEFLDNETTRYDRFLFEDELPRPATWIKDAVDNTKSYSAGGSDFATTTMAVGSNGEVLLSIFSLPKLEILYFFAKGAGAWRNGEPLPPLDEIRESLTSRDIVIRRPRNASDLSPGAQRLYDEGETQFRNEGFNVLEGNQLTALDILSLAEGKGPAKFLCCAKGWDFFIAASFAHAVGATVSVWGGKDSSSPVFPLSARLLEITRAKEREMFLVQWPCGTG